MTSPAGFAQAVYQLPSSAFDTPALVNPGSPTGVPPLSPSAAEQDAGDSNLPRRGSPILMDSLAELHAARPGYALADEMYNGDIGDLPVSDHVARLLAKSGMNEVEDLNYAKVPVDTIAEKLQIRAVMVTAGEQADDDGTPQQDETDTDTTADGPAAGTAQRKKITQRAQEALDQLRKRNQMQAEEPQLMHRASRYGDSYLFVWPVVRVGERDEQDPDGGLSPVDPDGDGLALMDASDPGKIEGVDIYVNSPYTVRAFYDPEQPLRLTHVIKSWEWIDPDDDSDDPKPRCRATLYFHDRVERWVTRPGGGHDIKNRDSWVPYRENPDDEWPIPNPPGVDRPPFFHFRNDRPYGVPEHRSAYGPQRLINKLISSHGVTIDFQTFPQRYALLDPKGDQALLNLIDPDRPEDEGDDPEADGYSQLRADPAAVWRLHAQSVGQFEPADPGVFITPLDRYIKAISELCGIPLDRFTGYTTPPSGESRRVGNEVLYEKVGNRRDLHGATLADAYRFALGLLGFKDLTVDVKWKPLDVASGPDDWTMAQSKIAAGVPVRNVLIETGYSEDEVDSWLLDQSGADLTRRVALLNSIGTAVQALAAGISVGMVSPEQAGDIVARVLGQVGQELPDLENPVSVHPQQQAQQMQMQNQLRGQQIAEHGAANPLQPPLIDGSPAPRPPLPDMPPPPPPVQVGGAATRNGPSRESKSNGR